MYPYYQSFLFLENSTVVSTVFGPSIRAYLCIVSMVSSTGKSNRCLNNFSVLEYCQVIHTFNLSYNLKNLTVASTIFWPLTRANLSIVSIFSFPGKFNRCFNNILALDYSHTTYSFDRFFSWKIQPLIQQYFGLGL